MPVIQKTVQILHSLKLIELALILFYLTVSCFFIKSGNKIWSVFYKNNFKILKTTRDSESEKEMCGAYVSFEFFLHHILCQTQ